MPLIYLQTERTAPGVFDLMQSWYIGAGAVEDKIIEWPEPNNDRLKAAIMNVGFACKDFGEVDAATKIIGIETDKDGKDVRHGGEHDILFALLCPPDDFEGRKLRSLYFEYTRYLGRIIYLCGQYDIRIVLQRREGVNYN